MLERQMKALRVDWDLMYEKFQRLSARLAKRVRDAEERAEEPQDERSPRDPREVRVTNPQAIALLGGRDHAVLPR